MTVAKRVSAHLKIDHPEQAELVAAESNDL